MATLVQPNDTVRDGNGGAAAETPVLQAVLVEESDASWQGIRQLATARYVIQGAHSQDTSAGLKGCAEQCPNPLSK